MRRLPPMGALEAFIIVSQHHSLKSASGELNLSVSALSRRIQGLEAYVGTPLFDRLHHELRLTAEGERLLAQVGPVFDTLSQILGEHQHSGTHSLRIGVPPSFAAAWLLPRLPRFRQRQPGIELHFDSSGSPLARLGGSLDAAILFAEMVEGDLHASKLKPQAAFAVAAPGLLARGATPRQVVAEHVLLLHGGLPKVLPLWLTAMGLADARPARIEHYDSGPMLLAAAEAGLGVALTLEDTVSFYPGAARLDRPFGEAVATPYSYYFVCREAALLGRALRRFRDWLHEEVGAGANLASPLVASR